MFSGAKVVKLAQKAIKCAENYRIGGASLRFVILVSVTGILKKQGFFCKMFFSGQIGMLMRVSLSEGFFRFAQRSHSLPRASLQTNFKNEILYLTVFFIYA